MLASMRLRSITSFAGSKCRHPVAAVADGEIGENVRAQTAEQKLRAKTADKIRFTRGGGQMRRRNAVAQDRHGRRPAGGGATVR